MKRVVLVDFLSGRHTGGHTGEYLGMLRQVLAPLAPTILAPYLDTQPPSGRLDRYWRFTRAMGSAFRRGEIVVFHTPEGRDVLVLWLLTFIPGMRRGHAVMMMRRGADAMTGREDWRARLLARLIQSLVHRGIVRLVSDSRAAARTWEMITGRAVPVISLPVRAALAEGRSAHHRHGPLQVSLLGLFRLEKGIDRYEAVLRAARAVEPDVRLFCQVVDRPGTPVERAVTGAILAAYGRDRNAEIHAGHLSTEEYDRALLTSDVVVLPYEPSLYTSGTSGLLFDALTAGAIVLSTRIAWGVDEFGDSSSVVWLAGRDDEALLAGLREALGRARRRRVDGMPADLPATGAFAAAWMSVIQEAMASPRA